MFRSGFSSAFRDYFPSKSSFFVSRPFCDVVGIAFAISHCDQRDNSVPRMASRELSEMNKWRFPVTFLGGMVCLLWLPMVAAKGLSQISGVEGYYVRMPSGDVYLFPFRKPTVNKKKHEKRCRFFGKHRRKPSRSARQWPRYRVAPSGFRPPPSYGWESQRPPYLPRFDAAKYPRR